MSIVTNKAMTEPLWAKKAEAKLQNAFSTIKQNTVETFAQKVGEAKAQLAAATVNQPKSTVESATESSSKSSQAAAVGVGVAVAPKLSNNSFFYGYNGKAYSLAPPTGDSFLASNGQTYTRQQIKDFYSRNPEYGADMTMMAKLGLKPPDLYKARFLAGQTDTNGTGIYTDPKEITKYDDYLRSAMGQAGGVSTAMAFDQWRNVQDASYLASLQTGPIENISWANGPRGGVEVRIVG